MSTVSHAFHARLETLFDLTTQAYEQAQTAFLQLERYLQRIQKDAEDASNANFYNAAQNKEQRVQDLLALVETIRQNTQQAYEKAQSAFEQIASTALSTASPPVSPNTTLTDAEFATLFATSSIAYLNLKNALLTLANAYLDDTLLQDNSTEHWAEKARDIICVFLPTNDDDTNHNQHTSLHQEIYTCLYESYYKPALHALKAKQWQEARQNLETLVQLKQNYKDARQLLGEIYAHLAETSIRANDMKQADTSIDLLYKLDPSNTKIAAFSQNYPRFLYYRWQANKRLPGLWLFEPHADAKATCLALSPNGQLLAIGFSSGKICIYTTTKNELISTPDGRHKGEIRSIAFAHDNETLASGDALGVIKLWNAYTGGADAKFPNPAKHPIEKVTFLAHSLAFQFSEANLHPHMYIWDRQDHGIRKLKATCIAFEATKQLSAFGFLDGPIEIEEPAGRKNTSPQAHGGKVVDISFSPHKPYFSSAAENNTIKLWSLQDKMPLLLTHPGSTMAFSSDGNLFASADPDGSLILWQTDSRERYATFSLPDPLPEEHILKMFFSPDQQFWLLISEERILIASMKQISANTTGILPLPVVLTQRYEGGEIKRDSIVLSSHPLSLFFCDEHGTVASLRPQLEPDGVEEQL